MHSRLPTYLHPLAGRPLAWHAVAALAALQPPPENLFLIGGPELAPELFGGLVPEVRTLTGLPGADELDANLLSERVVVVDAAAPAIGTALPALLAAPERSYLPTQTGAVAAVVLSAEAAAAAVQSGRSVAEFAAGSRLSALSAAPEALVVADRRSLAAASRMIHDRLIARLMREGVTFLLPESILVDVDVRIGRDTIVYPGAVLEGQTVIGEETVIGPGCRIIDAWIGSGVELKGWNFISRASVRNRAILEPYVRRGFD